MTITVIGTGFVGVVTSAVFASFKNTVYGLDVDEQKINTLKTGTIPFFEPGLKELVKKSLDSNYLKFTTSYKTAISQSDVIFLAVGTPSAPDGTADLTYILAASKSLAPHLKKDAIIAVKSTVPPGTNQKIHAKIQAHTAKPFFVASTPEFLKEGSAVQDTLQPDRIVIGASQKKVISTLLQLHKPLEGARVVVSPESAQMAKYTANAYLAQRITFINQIANLCERNGADINQVIEAIGPDRRIGTHYWYPGLGYGGSCFPKDVKELAAYSRSIGEGDGLLVKLDELNDRRIPQLLDRFGSKIGGWKGKNVAVLGLSFKPQTDDMREAPSTKVIPILTKAEATISAYDPQASKVAKKLFPTINYKPDPLLALKNADVCLLLIEWPELINLDLRQVAKQMRGKWFIDTRNQYNPKEVKQAGLQYIGIGRS